MAEDAGMPMRDMENPQNEFNSKLNMNFPNYWYQSGNWYIGTSDRGGVHHNATAHNRYFYLLSMGGTQLGVNVQGIGIVKAGKITNYSAVNLTSSLDGFRQARENALAAAELIHRKNSFEYNEVCKAYAAINIGTCIEEEEEEEKICWRDFVCQYNESGYGEMTELSNNTLDNKISSLFIYPNPTNDIIYFQFGEIKNSKINLNTFNYRILSPIGKLLSSGTINSEILENGISLDSYSAGLYYIQIFSENLILKTFKITKL